jgi:hypothetical protein
MSCLVDQRASVPRSSGVIAPQRQRPACGQPPSLLKKTACSARGHRLAKSTAALVQCRETRLTAGAKKRWRRSG